MFLGDDSTPKIIGCGRVKFLLKDGRIRTLLGVLLIPYLARNLTYVNKMNNASVHTIFENDKCKMVRGATILMRGVLCGTLYKLVGRTIIDGCNNSIALESENEEKSLMFMEEVLCRSIKDWGILERRVFNHYKVKEWLKVCVVPTTTPPLV